MDYASTRFWDIIYPYLLWSIIYVGSSQIFSHLTAIHKPLGLKDLLNITWAPIHVLWFLYSLLILQIFSVALFYIPAWGRWMVIVAIAAAYILMPAGISGPFAASLAYAPFFSCGYFLAASRRPLVSNLLASPFAILTSAAAFALGTWVAWELGAAQPVSAETLMVSALGVATLASVASTISNSQKTRWVASHLAWIGTLSLPIYLLHVLTLALVPRALHALGVTSVTATLVVGTLVGVYGSLLLFVLIRRAGLANALALSPGRPFKRAIRSRSSRA